MICLSFSGQSISDLLGNGRSGAGGGGGGLGGSEAIVSDLFKGGRGF